MNRKKNCEKGGAQKNTINQYVFTLNNNRVRLKRIKFEHVSH